jgi:hypothetical protein
MFALPNHKTNPKLLTQMMPPQDLQSIVFLFLFWLIKQDSFEVNINLALT